MSIKFVSHRNRPTKEAIALMLALEDRGIKVKKEFFDGHKHIDLVIPKSKINIEVDGIKHLTDPHQILADLNRGYYSTKKGYNTMHIPNEMIKNHLAEISKGLAEAAKMREKKLYIHLE